MRSSSFPRWLPAAFVRSAYIGALLTVVASTAASAQVSQSSRPAPRSVPVVSYQVLWRTEFLARPDTAAPVLAWLDSGQVVVPDGPETYQTGHARIVVNGKRGWVDNGYIKRVVTMRATDTVLTVTPRRRTTPAPRPGDPRQPDRVLPARRP
ncbi:MAG TPA: hypothetical protein VEA99_10230 [Gemmatimonadaceae bacterium]|nr:hypothetical protein [Gemmatimonadaceae bacterium]